MKVQANSKSAKPGERGFSMIELLIVLAVIMIVAAVAVPNIVSAMRDIRLREGAVNYAAIAQRARLRAVQDNNYYPVAVGADGTGAQVAYVDLTKDASGNAVAFASGEPDSPISTEVTFPNSGFPGTSGSTGLYCLFIPCTAGAVTPTSTDPSGSGPWIYFSPRGIPCKIVGGVCNTSGGSVAYVTFLQSNTTQKWEAVTVTPAGRVQIWGYDGTNWNRLD